MDLILGLVSIAASITVFAVSFNYDNYMYDVVGGGGFPRMLAVIIILCSLAIIGQYLYDRKKGLVRKAEKGDTKAAGSLVLGVLVYILVLEHVGYLVTTVLLVAFLLWIQGERSKKTLITSAAVICGLLYVVFVLVLKVKLPQGFLI